MRTEAKYGKTVDLTFSGINTFAHLPHRECLDQDQEIFDIAIVGAPFDVRRSDTPYYGNANVRLIVDKCVFPPW